MLKTERPGTPEAGIPEEEKKPDFFRSGDYVRVRQTPEKGKGKGKLEDDWWVAGTIDENVEVRKTVGDNLIGKTIPEDELIRMQVPELGETVFVQRSSGKLESGWEVSGYQDKDVIVAKGREAKVIPVRELIGMQMREKRIQMQKQK